MKSRGNKVRYKEEKKERKKDRERKKRGKSNRICG